MKEQQEGAVSQKKKLEEAIAQAEEQGAQCKDQWEKFPDHPQVIENKQKYEEYNLELQGHLTKVNTYLSALPETFTDETLANATKDLNEIA